MKNRFLPLLFFFFLSTAVMAQTATRLGQHTAITNWTVPANGIANAAQGKDLVKQIIDAVGLAANFEIVPANIDNAAAIVYGGRRYILYNPIFINNLIKTTGTQWAAISVLAHEIGHHLNGHTVMATGSQPAMELQADEFSGYVLRKMGATLEQSEAAMKTLATTNATTTHPAQYDRLASIEKGWQHADDQLAGRKTIRKEPAVETSVTTPVAVTDVAINRSAPALDSRLILGDVYFNAAPSSTFRITTNYTLVKVSDGGVSLVGKLAALNSTQFPYLIYDEQHTQLFVDKQGNIITPAGKQVGYLRNHNE